MEFVQCDIRNLQWKGQIVDTIVMNPPFGTRKKGADMDFLFVALKVASQAVYSLHKTTTREHIKRAALRDYNASSAEVICEVGVLYESCIFFIEYKLVYMVFVNKILSRFPA
nr:methyltransferase-like protein 5 [Ipomoea batatas]GME00384.1 methyltransferase-like protein 5 [Ipomoea batatas]